MSTLIRIDYLHSKFSKKQKQKNKIIIFFFVFLGIHVCFVVVYFCLIKCHYGVGVGGALVALFSSQISKHTNSAGFAQQQEHNCFTDTIREEFSISCWTLIILQ